MKDGNWWSLDAAKINHLQQDSIVALVKRCKAAHFVNVHVRINGKWEVYEADWIKHLQPRPRPILAAWREALWWFKRLRWRIQDARWRRNPLPQTAAPDAGMERAHSEPPQSSLPQGG
jgi:hypothetical protein